MFGWLEVVIMAILLAFGAGFGFGYHDAKGELQKDIIRAQQAQMAAADLASRKEAERLSTEQQKIEIARQMEDAANAQAPAATCLPASRVMRLNQR